MLASRSKFLQLESRSKLLQLASKSKFLQLGSRSKLLQLGSLDYLFKISWNPSLILRFSSPKIHFFLLKIWFCSTAFRFPRNPRKSSSTAFQFLQPLSDFRETFFNGFPQTNYSFQRRLFESWKLCIRRRLFESWKLCVRRKLFVSWIIFFPLWAS